jgi:hypothetical protein
MATVFTRLLDDFLAELALIPGHGLVSDEFAWPEKISPTTAAGVAQFPVVIVELVGEGEQELQPHGRIVENHGVDVYGYVNTALTGAGGRQKQREEWLALVFNRLTGEAFQQRLIATMQANGGVGCGLVKPDGPAIRDGGDPAMGPYGAFRQRMIARLHYSRGGM